MSTEDDQYDRVRSALQDSQLIATRMQIMPEAVSDEEKERAFNALVDVGTWNKEHPDRKLGRIAS